MVNNQFEWHTQILEKGLRELNINLTGFLLTK